MSLTARAADAASPASVGHINSVGREHDDVDKCIGMIIVGEKRTEYTVNKTSCKDLVIGCATFTLQEAAGETAVR